MTVTIEEEQNMSNAVQNIVKASIEALRTGEGFTITAETGEPYTGTLWLVGGIIPSITLTEQESAEDFYRRVENWYEAVVALDGDKGLIGGWVHNGTLYLDLVSLFSEEEQAVTIGRMWQQLAIGHLDDEGNWVEQFIG